MCIAVSLLNLAWTVLVQSPTAATPSIEDHSHEKQCTTTKSNSSDYGFMNHIPPSPQKIKRMRETKDFQSAFTINEKSKKSSRLALPNKSWHPSRHSIPSKSVSLPSVTLKPGSNNPLHNSQNNLLTQQFVPETGRTIKGHKFGSVITLKERSLLAVANKVIIIFCHLACLATVFIV